MKTTFPCSRRSRSLLAGAALLTMVAGLALGVPVITNLGTLPSDDPNWSASVAGAISADGSVVTGWSNDKAFRWTSAGGMQSLGVLAGGAESFGHAVSADGSVCVGEADSPTALANAVRWTGGAWQNLGTLPTGTYEYASATGVNSDGTIVVGYLYSFDGDRAFRWSGPEGMIDMGLLPGGDHARARAVSADGQVATGVAVTVGGWRAFRWTLADGMQNLGVLPGGPWSEGLGVSADGSTIVGYSRTSSDDRAFRWTVADGMQDLGAIAGGNSSRALCVSADGTVIAGYRFTTTGYRAFMWTGALGMVDLNTYLPSLGLNLSGWTLLEARGLSSNGRLIAGTGFFNGEQRAFVVNLDGQACSADFDQSGSVSVNDLFAFLAAWFAQNGGPPGSPSADFDQSGSVSVNDLFAFLAAWFEQNGAAGCGP